MNLSTDAAGGQSASDQSDRSFTIKEWCERRRVSQPMFFKLLAGGGAPRTHRVGRRRLISGEADGNGSASAKPIAAARLRECWLHTARAPTPAVTGARPG